MSAIEQIDRLETEVDRLRDELEEQEERHRKTLEFAAAIIVQYGERAEGGGYRVHIDNRTAEMISPKQLTVEQFTDRERMRQTVIVYPTGVERVDSRA